MQQNEQLARWLDDFTLHDAENDEDIHFTALQKHDLNLLLQKQYSLIQWEQGSGKTLAGIATGTYRYAAAKCLLHVGYFSCHFHQEYMGGSSAELRHLLHHHQ